MTKIILLLTLKSFCLHGALLTSPSFPLQPTNDALQDDILDCLERTLSSQERTLYEGLLTAAEWYLVSSLFLNEEG